jgi:hypothetical protein
MVGHDRHRYRAESVVDEYMRTHRVGIVVLDEGAPEDAAFH